MRAPLILATAIAAAVLAVPALASASVSPAVSSTKSASFGATWLATQITANGGYLMSFGAPDVSNTAYAVLALHAAGHGKAASDLAMTYLESHLGALHGRAGDRPGPLAYFIMAAIASGQDPHHFGGTKSRNDLVARLLATSRASGPDSGLFGVQDPTFDGAFRQGLALAALEAAGVTAAQPAVAAGIAWLEGQQCANGLWTSYLPDTTQPCPPADPETFTGPDTNSTGMAVQGLAAYGERPRRHNLVASLHVIETDDAGFSYIAGGPSAADPDSTALVIQALVALGENPTGDSWTKGGANPLTELVSFQLSCGDPAADRGAFFFPGTRDANVFATVQSVPAAAREALPLPASTPSDSLQSAKCA